MEKLTFIADRTVKESYLKTALKKRGLGVIDLLKCGLFKWPASAEKYYNHLYNLPVEYVLYLEKRLGIPRYELRPDLWPPPPAKVYGRKIIKVMLTEDEYRMGQYKARLMGINLETLIKYAVQEAIREETFNG